MKKLSEAFLYRMPNRSYLELPLIRHGPPRRRDYGSRSFERGGQVRASEGSKGRNHTVGSESMIGLVFYLKELSSL